MRPVDRETEIGGALRQRAVELGAIAPMSRARRATTRSSARTICIALMVKCVQAGRLGRKSGRGVYDYSNDEVVLTFEPSCAQ